MGTVQRVVWLTAIRIIALVGNNELRRSSSHEKTNTQTIKETI